MSAICISCLYCEAFSIAPSSDFWRGTLESHIIKILDLKSDVTMYPVVVYLPTIDLSKPSSQAQEDDNTTRLDDDLPEGSNAKDNISSAADDSVPEDNDDNLLNLDLTNFCAKWILRISETRKLTRTATVGIVQDMSDLLMEVSACIKEQVRKSLQKNEINFEAIRGTNEIFFI